MASHVRDAAHLTIHTASCVNSQTNNVTHMAGRVHCICTLTIYAASPVSFFNCRIYTRLKQLCLLKTYNNGWYNAKKKILFGLLFVFLCSMFRF